MWKDLQSSPRRRIPDAAARWVQGVRALAFGAALLGATRMPDAGWIRWPFLGFLLLGLTCAGALAYFSSSGSDPRAPVPGRRPWGSPVWMLCAILMVYLSSSAITDPWFFPTRWHAGKPLASNPLAFGAVRSLLEAGVIALLFRRIARPVWPWAVVTLACAGLAVARLYEATGFDMIYRVDSPSFVYRFWSFAQTFPKPAFYDPHWNAGMPVPYLVASGVWSVGVFLLPFLARISPEHVYTPALAIAGLVLVPALAWLSMAWIGGRRRARWIAALFALGFCQRFWVHLLHYGTMPALVAMCMALPLAALWYKYLYRDPGPRWTTLAGLLFFGLIFFAWPGSVIIAALFGVVTLFHVRRLLPVKWMGALAVGAILAAVLWPLARVPLRYSDIDAFARTTLHRTLWEHGAAGLETLRGNLRGTHALILVWGILGGIFWTQRRARGFFAPLILALVVVSGWGEEVKKLLQTERLIIPAALIAILPAAWWLDRLLRGALAVSGRRAAGAALRGFASWMIALAWLGGYQGAKTWDGRGLAPFHAMPESTRNLASWLAGHVPEGGRILFAGPAVHGYGGAKVAAFPMFTGREAMACDFYGFSPKLVEFQYPPRAFRHSGPDVLFEFMELYNITHVVTWHENWKDVFTRDEAHYRPAVDFGRPRVFETRRVPSMFLKGEGRVTATFDRLEIEQTGEPGPVVIKYNWAEGWVSDPDVRIFPYDAGRGVTLIGIDPGPHRHITLRFQSRYEIRRKRNQPSGSP